MLTSYSRGYVNDTRTIHGHWLAIRLIGPKEISVHSRKPSLPCILGQFRQDGEQQWFRKLRHGRSHQFGIGSIHAQQFEHNEPASATPADADAEPSAADAQHGRHARHEHGNDEQWRRNATEYGRQWEWQHAATEQWHEQRTVAGGIQPFASGTVVAANAKSIRYTEHGIQHASNAARAIPKWTRTGTASATTATAAARGRK